VLADLLEALLTLNRDASNMEQGEMVLIDYTAKTEGEIFDTTREEVAVENGLEREDTEYKPVPVLIGSGYVIEGLEEAVEDMEVGDERNVQIPPEKGYGSRDSDNMETYPEREFEKQGVTVNPGEEVMIGQRRGKVISKGSGRVRIDFNHPLSGKELEYNVEVIEKLEDDQEIAEKVFDFHVGHGDIEFEDGKVKIPSKHSHGDHEHELPEELKEKLTEEIEDSTTLEVEFV